MANNLNLGKVADIKIRNDGNEIQITFIGTNGQSLTVTASLLKMDYLLKELDKISAAVRVTRILAADAPPDKPRDFTPMPETFLALDSEFLLREGGGLDLRVQTDDEHNVQLSLLPAHVQILRQLLEP